MELRIIIGERELDFVPIYDDLDTPEGRSRAKKIIKLLSPYLVVMKKDFEEFGAKEAKQEKGGTEGNTTGG